MISTILPQQIPRQIALYLSVNINAYNNNSNAHGKKKNISSVERTRSNPNILSIELFFEFSCFSSCVGSEERPWSAAEPRWNADRMFHSEQKGWEGLARKAHK